MQARLAADPALASEAERLRRVLEGLRESAARDQAPVNAAVPADFWPRLQRRLELAATPRPARQIGWMAGVGATAALALAAALLFPIGLPMGPPGHSGGNAKLAKTNPPVKAGQTAQKDTVRPAVHPVPIIAAVPRPIPVPPPVQVAQAPPPTLTVSNPGPFAVPTPPDPVAARKPLPAALPLPPPAPANLAPVKLVPVKPVSAKVMADKPTLMASSRLNGLQNGDRAVSENAPLPASPLAFFDTPPPAPRLDQVTPLPLGTSAKAIPSADSVNGPGQMTAPIHSAAASQAVTKSDSGALPPPLPRDKPQAFVAPRFYVRARRMAGARKIAVPQTNSQAGDRAASDDGAPPAGQSLETWQAALSAAVQPPLWGENIGEQQVNQTLMATREAGQLDILRSRLEARREQSPQDLSVGRMLAAVYGFGFQSDLVLGERRRIVGLTGAGGEDWFALAQAEERVGNAQAARAAYRRALEAPVPPNSFHAALARQRE